MYQGVSGRYYDPRDPTEISHDFSEDYPGFVKVTLVCFSMSTYGVIREEYEDHYDPEGRHLASGVRDDPFLFPLNWELA